MINEIVNVLEPTHDAVIVGGTILFLLIKVQGSNTELWSRILIKMKTQHNERRNKKLFISLNT